MKLQKGMCFLCSNTKVVKPTLNPEIYKIITVLLSNELLNSTEFSRIQPLLRFCPICYHKLIIAERYKKNMKSNISNEDVSTNNCLLCKNENNLFEVSEWPSFKNILKDLALSKDASYISCSECLYCLEIEKEVKTRLFSKYPQLRVQSVSSNLNKGGSKRNFIPKIKLKAVPLVKKNNGDISRKRKFHEVLNRSPVNFNFESVKRLKPLKDDRRLRNHKVVKTDTKFLNQVPYVLLKNSSSSDFDSNSTIDEDKCIESTSKQNIYSSVQNKKNNKRSKKLIMRSEYPQDNMCKHDNEKYLVVNVSRIELEKYFPKDEAETGIQNSVDKDPILQNLDQAEDKSYIDKICETSDNIVEDTENKNKRKSVSFAEDKNIEIEYFENDASIKYRNHISNIEQSETIGKKYSKGILKRDDNMDDIINNSINENGKILSEAEEIYEESNSSSNIKKNIENDEENGNNSSDSNLDYENLIESYKEPLGERERIIKNDVENENESKKIITNKDERDIQRTKSKPLSKKKRRYTVAENINEKDNTNHNNQDANKEEKQHESIPENTCSEQSIKDNTLEEEIVYMSADEDRISLIDKEDDPVSLPTQKVFNIETSKDEQLLMDSEDITDKSKSDENVNEPVKGSKNKRHKPKPLSKKKKAHIAKEDEDRMTENDSNIIKGNEMNDLDEKKTEKDDFSEEKNINSECGNIESEINIKGNSNCNKDNEIEEKCNSQIISVTKDDSDNSKSENIFNTVQEIEEKSLLQEEDKNKSSIEDDTHPIYSTPEHDTDITTDIETCDILSKNDMDANNKKEEIPTSTSENNISYSDVTQLVDKFLNTDDGGDNTETIEKSAQTIDDEFDEERIIKNNISDSVDISGNVFGELLKEKDLGTPDPDSENIDSIYSHLFLSEGKKKKKVTFCDDIT